MSQDTKENGGSGPPPGPPRKKKIVTEDEVRVLIVAAKPTGLQSTKMFLQRRGWPCKVVSNTKDALAVLQKDGPTHVLFSWNIPNANVEKMERAISSSFNVPVIIFAEKSDATQIARMAKMGMKHTIPGPVSGPGVQMKIRRMIREEMDADKTDEGRARRRKGTRVSTGADVAEDDGWSTKETEISYNPVDLAEPIFAEAEDLPEGGTWEKVRSQKGKEIWKFNSEDKTNDESGNYYFDGPFAPQKNESGGWTLSGGSLNYSNTGPDFEFLRKRPETKKAWYESLNEDDGWTKKKQKTYTFEVDRPSENRDDAIIQRGAKGHEFSLTQQSGANSGEFSFGQNDGAKGGDFEFSQNTPSGNDLGAVSTKESANGFTGSFSRTAMVGSDGRESILLEPKSRKTSSKTSVLAEAAERALKDVMKPQGEYREVVQQTRNVGVVPISSNRFRGFLLFACGANQPVDTDFVWKVREKLKGYLKEKGEILSGDEQMLVELDVMDFSTWAADAAEFLLVGQQGSDEVAMAFLEAEDIVPTFDESAEPTFAAVIRTEIRPETPVNFDLFLRLPINRRYVKYLRSGQFVTEKQMEKFKKHGLRHFHIKIEDMERFKSYRTSQILNDRMKPKATKAA